MKYLAVLLPLCAWMSFISNTVSEDFCSSGNSGNQTCPEINDTVCQEIHDNATVSQEMNATKTAEIREKIAKVAEGLVGSTFWAYGAKSGYGKNTYKCQHFVYHIGRISGAKMPIRTFFDGNRGPVGAGESGWGDPKAQLKCWTRVCTPQRGDIVAACRNGNYHVGIHVGPSTTVSANPKNIGKNAWPSGEGDFKGKNKVYWRYTC